MKDLHFRSCTCRNKYGEMTLLGQFVIPLKRFKEEYPERNINDFLDEHQIMRMCCRRTLMSPYAISLIVDKDEHQFRTDIIKEGGEKNAPSLDYLDVIPNPSIDFP